MAALYKKLFTPLKETLEDDYPDLNPKLISEKFNNVGVKFVHVLRTDNGLKLKTTSVRDPNTNFTTTLEPEFKIPKYNLTLEGKIGTDRKFQKTVSLVDLFGEKGSKVFLRGIHEDGNISGEFGFEFKNSNVSLNGHVNKPLEGHFRGHGAGVFKHNNFSLGGDVEYDQEKGVTRYGGKIQHDHNDSSFFLFMNDLRVPKKKDDKPKQDIGFGYFHKLRHDLNGAFDFKVDNNLETDIRVGSDLKVNDSTNFKSRLILKRNELRVGLSYKQKLTPTTKVIVSTDLNSRSFFGTTDDSNIHRFNFTFSCGDD